MNFSYSGVNENTRNGEKYSAKKSVAFKTFFQLKNRPAKPRLSLDQT